MNYLESYRRGLGSTGAASSQIPAQYLVPMNKLEIYKFIQDEKKKGRSSKYFGDCAKYREFDFPCFYLNLELEKTNLLFVNGFIPYGDNPSEPFEGSALYYYKILQAEFESIPYLESTAENFKKVGRGLVTMVTTFLKMGPVGIFVGTGKAIMVDINEQRAKMSAMGAEKFNQNYVIDQDRKDDIDNERNGNPIIKLTIITVAAVAVFGSAFYALD